MSKAPTQSIQEIARELACPNCGAPTARRAKTGRSPVFCSPACRKEATGRDLARGSALINIAQAWRQARGSGELGKTCLAEMCAILDDFNAQDRAAGRPGAQLRAAKMLDSGYRYLDRKNNWGTKTKAKAADMLADG